LHTTGGIQTNNGETLTQLRNNETWTAQDNYENDRHHNIYVANRQVNVQYPSGNLQVQSERRNSGYGKKQLKDNIHECQHFFERNRVCKIKKLYFESTLHALKCIYLVWHSITINILCAIDYSLSSKHAFHEIFTN